MILEVLKLMDDWEYWAMEAPKDCQGLADAFLARANEKVTGMIYGGQPWHERLKDEWKKLHEDDEWEGVTLTTEEEPEPEDITKDISWWDK